MSTRTANAQSSRPIRDLLRPTQHEQPMAASHAPERRQHPRYSRCLIGTMTTNGRELPVACVDISLGGAQVVTPEAVQLGKGERVAVQIHHASWSYADEFSVVQTDRMPTGTAVHLQL